MDPPRTAVAGQVDAVSQTTLLSAADCDFVKGFQDSLSAETANGRDCGGLLPAILRHLEHFKERIQIEETKNEDDLREHASVALPPLLDVWGPVTAEAHTSHGGSEVSITGPGPDDRFQVPVSSPADASRTVSLRISINWQSHST